MGEVMQDRVARYLEVIAKPDTLDVICQRVSDGEGLSAICKAWDIPHGRVLAWLEADVKRFAAYQNALRAWADARALATTAVVDAGPEPGVDVARDKLRTDQSFKLARHLAPAVWGEKVEHNHKGVPVFQVNIIGAPVVEKDVTPPAMGGLEVEVL